MRNTWAVNDTKLSPWNTVNRLNAKWNPIYHFLALFGAHPIIHVSRIRVNLLWGAGRVTLYRLDHPVLDPRRRKRFSFRRNPFSPTLEADPASSKGYRDFFPELNRPRRGIDQPPPWAPRLREGIAELIPFCPTQPVPSSHVTGRAIYLSSPIFNRLELRSVWFQGDWPNPSLIWTGFWFCCGMLLITTEDVCPQMSFKGRYFGLYSSSHHMQSKVPPFWITL